jgi:hypothetical protein
MTPHKNGEPIRYKIEMAVSAKKQLLAMHRKRAEAGTGTAVVAAFRKIIERLQTDPLVFGELSYRLPALQLQVRQGGIRPLVVNYAVHETQPLVFIRVFSLLA